MLTLAFIDSARGQVISPGKLSGVHADIEGVTNCTRCHQLGERGVSADLCLDCHKPLAARIRERKGYHAGVLDKNCAACHKEHFGPTASIVRLDTTKFDHRLTGFDLVASHTRVSCRGCHKPDFIADIGVREFKASHGALESTFLGTSTLCGTCHLSVNPHGNQFVAKDCSSCHSEDTWEETGRFDHATTRFPLAGRHADAQCSSCHKSIVKDGKERFVYTGMEFSDCSSCHEDRHRGAMAPKSCDSCHRPSGWHDVSTQLLKTSFDHSRTGFDLVGRHKEIACESCHAKPARRTADIQIRFVAGTGSFSFPHPMAAACTSCHRDYHDGVFHDGASGEECSGCHSERNWNPADYDIERHAREVTSFALTGAHVAAPCAACHREKRVTTQELWFALDDLRCVTCHVEENVHADRFGDPYGEGECGKCHDTDAWFVGVRFDHDVTTFPLTGSHRRIACESCHVGPGGERKLVGINTACASCHGEDDPHQSQFEESQCVKCHDTESFRIAAFDHAKTRFPLEGAHVDVACAFCHTSETASNGTEFVRFKPLGIQCVDCHASQE